MRERARGTTVLGDILGNPIEMKVESPKEKGRERELFEKITAKNWWTL